MCGISMTRLILRALAFSFLAVGFASTASAQSAPLTLGPLFQNDGSSAFGAFVYPDEKNLAISLGINGASGNSEAFSWLMGVDMTRKADVHTWVVDFDYARVETDGTRSQNFALLTADYDRQFEEGSPWSLFGQGSVLVDEFRDFDYRLAFNGGLGYKWIDTDDLLFQTRTGFGTSSEIGGADDEWKPELVLGFDLRKTLSEEQTCGVSVDWYPNVSDFGDYRLVTDAFWQIKIASPDFFLRLSAIDYYDSTPGTAQPNDLFYGAQLLWKPY